MNATSKGWLKKILIAAGILIIGGVAVVIYVFTRSFEDTADTKAAFEVSANKLIGEFAAATPVANKKYTEQIVTVSGRVTEVESADTTVNIKMTDTATGSYVIFAFQSNAMAAAKKVKEGDSVSVKGSCSGGSYSDILELYHVDFKRCVISK